MLEELAAGRLDDDLLCSDILGFDHGDLDSDPSVIVWGDPSDPSAWEVNTAFLRKWGYLLRGCPEIIESTNIWRIRRGERCLRASSL